MIVISKNGNKVVNFNSGVWERSGKDINLCERGYSTTFASYESESEASADFERMMEAYKKGQYTYQFKEETSW